VLSQTVAVIGSVITLFFGVMLGADWGDCSTQPDPAKCRRPQATDIFIKPFNILVWSSGAQFFMAIWACCGCCFSNEDRPAGVELHNAPMATGAAGTATVLVYGNSASGAYEYNQISGSDAFVQINRAD
jgi:hypothetical protein